MAIVSKTALKKILAESIFDPREKGPMKPIVDMADPHFLRQRAIQLLHEVEWSDQPDDCICMAISLLALARWFGSRTTDPKSPEYPKNPYTRK